jgi:N,N'-diacetyllegionaminate synthase
MQVKINNTPIGPGAPCYIIAEAGINHNNDLKQAKKMVATAKKAGANAIKFQIFEAEELCSTKSEYYELFKSLELSKKVWREISDYSKKQGIVFTASIFGESSADFLDELDSPFFKFASADITHLPLLEYVAGKKKPMLLSCGMATIGEVEEAVNLIRNNGNDQIMLMHCVSNYPTKYEESNIRVIKTLKDIFQVPVGFSDHSLGIIAPLAAVSLGADLIEKHYTLDRELPGPDHSLSIEPNELEDLVKNSRIIEDALGNGVKTITDAELKTRELARRSIVANTDISEGDTITKEMIRIVRPADGIPPKHMSLVLGRKAKRSIPKEDLLKWDDI